MNNTDDIWNSNDIDSIDKKINQSANDDLDGIESSLNHIHELDDESFSELQDRAKEMIDDLSRNAFKKYFKGLINLRRKSFQEE
tara:strand:- start:1933 stop:2184 length:252 start_codon:yes stop_codon:yes gene_type:complete